MKRKSFLNLGALLLSLFLLIGATSKAEAYEEVVIKNGDRTLVFKKMPEKVLCTNLASAENMVMLGLVDKIVAKNIPDNDSDVPLKELEEIFEKIPTIERSFENVVALETDFIISRVSGFKEGGSWSWGSYQKLENLGINAYTISGSITNDETIKNVYEDISALGKIFKIEDKSDELINSMKDRLNKVKNSVKDIKDDQKVKVFVMDSFKGNQIYTTSKGLQSNLIEIAGGINVTKNKADARWFNTSVETIVETNPDIIIFNDYGNGSTEEKIKMIDENIALQDVNAVKNKKYYVIPLVMVMQNVRAVDSAEMFAEYFYKK